MSTSPRYTLDPALPADADLLARLHSDSWRHAYAGLIPLTYLESHAPAERLATWRARMHDGAEAPIEVTILRIDGEPAGFCCLMPLAEPGYGIYVDNLHVMPAYHGGGYGKLLMAHCVRRVIDRWPGKPLFLYVLDGNTQARAFYRALGGEEAPAFDDPFPGTDLMVSVRRVTWQDPEALLARLLSSSKGRARG
ncbi:hypothetical protein LMG32289_04294 [Cupriavidus pampae]|jgi:ribosomal protein S18 acetylase RimI-like enzyme|uniref:N-acetyltransferase domain-containing protein n=1 Tax=Cupriavidus pampae TaxID=659251 RepID=A0ABN7Z4A9_9BURK|nr:hypothetical protein LMG32289_04294 [Cupriavidus pampae]